MIDLEKLKKLLADAGDVDDRQALLFVLTADRWDPAVARLLAAAPEALAELIAWVGEARELMSDTLYEHRVANDCTTDPCQWCVEAAALLVFSRPKMKDQP